MRNCTWRSLQRILSLAIVLTFFNGAFAEEPEDHQYRVKFWDTVTEIPQTALDGLKSSISKEAILPWALITASTLYTYSYDQDMVNEVQRWGRKSGIGNADMTRTVANLGEYPLLRVPTDTGSALYFLGDGWTHFGIAGSFLLAGQIKKRNRPHNTGLQIVHGMMVSTMFNQFLKRTTGRETPNGASEPRGKWRPFPSIAAYNKDQSKYDAFPSGHVMTATVVFTVININYPEYSMVTIPIASVWISVLALQMMNNGVHWASDYPLAIGMGWLFGKLATRLGKPPEQQTVKEAATSTIYYPSIHAESGTPTLNVMYRF